MCFHELQAEEMKLVDYAHTWTSYQASTSESVHSFIHALQSFK